MADQAVQSAQSKLKDAIEFMTANAIEVLRQASQSGPLLSGHLQVHAEKPSMALDDLDTASRVYDRMLRTSREVLNLDAEKTVNVVVLGTGKISAASASVQTVIDVPSSPVAQPIDEDPSI